jgi:hypothetical protein
MSKKRRFPRKVKAVTVKRVAGLSILLALTTTTAAATPQPHHAAR